MRNSNQYYLGYVEGNFWIFLLSKKINKTMKKLNQTVMQAACYDNWG